MTRLQILELPAGASDRKPAFALVVDQYQPLHYVQVLDQDPHPVDEFGGIAEQIGARAVLVFRESVEIPDNEPLSRVEVVDPVERAGTTEIVYAHERTRLDLCNALLLSGDTTWRQIVEQVAARQKSLAASVRSQEELRAESRRRGKVKLEYAERIRQLEGELAEARQWARHGYEIGQRHCSWSDHGVVPAWLTEGWPASFDSCEYLKQAAAFDEALTRVRSTPTEPEVMNSEQERPDIWRHGYKCGVLASRSAAAPRHEETI